MKSALITIAFLLSSLVLSAQESLEIKGMLYDSETLHSLTDGHVYIEGTSIGTISNQIGHFKIDIPESMKGETLKISYVGYETVETRVEDIKDLFIRVAMVPAVTALPEIVICAEEPTAIAKATSDEHKGIKQAGGVTGRE